MRSGRWAGAALAVAALAGGAGGCGRDDGASGERPGVGLASRGFAIDDRGKTLAVDPPRRRVVSLVPSLTETIVAAGGAASLVARTRFDLDPRLTDLASVGGSLDPDLETLTALEPDLVVVWGGADHRALPSTLEEMGIDTYVAEPEHIDDFRRHARALGSLLGIRPRADSLVAAVDAGLARVRAPSPAVELRSVLFLVWPGPVVTTGGGTFVDELIRVAGGRGVFDDLADPWPTISMESVLARDPYVVLLADERAPVRPLRWIPADARWRLLDAVAAGRAYRVDADLFNRPGPRIVEAAEVVARLLSTPAAKGGS